MSYYINLLDLLFKVGKSKSILKQVSSSNVCSCVQFQMISKCQTNAIFKIPFSCLTLLTQTHTYEGA